MGKKSVACILILMGMAAAGGARGEDKRATKSVPPAKQELTSEEIDIIDNYQLLESLDMLKDMDLFNNYEVLVDSSNTQIGIKKD